MKRHAQEQLQRQQQPQGEILKKSPVQSSTTGCGENDPEAPTVESYMRANGTVDLFLPFLGRV